MTQSGPIRHALSILSVWSPGTNSRQPRATSFKGSKWAESGIAVAPFCLAEIELKRDRTENWPRKPAVWQEPSSGFPVPYRNFYRQPKLYHTFPIASNV